MQDLAEGHLAALEFLQQNSGRHVFNLGTGRGYSVLEMIAAFEAASKMGVPYQVVERRGGDSAACYADAGKAATKLGWRAKRTLAEMCASQWRWETGGVPLQPRSS